VKPLIFNAIPLIYITKVGLSRVFEGLKNEKLTSPHVKKEVVDEGKRRGVPDAFILEKMFKSEVFKVAEPKGKEFFSKVFGNKGASRN